MTPHRIQQFAAMLIHAAYYDLTSTNQIRVFLALATNCEPMTAKAVSGITGVVPALCNTIFRTLGDRDLATLFKARCAETGRENLVCDLTGKGRMVAVKMGIGGES